VTPTQNSHEMQGCHQKLTCFSGDYEHEINYNSTTNSPMTKGKVARSCQMSYLADSHILKKLSY
jgi:hypothetical protein